MKKYLGLAKITCPTFNKIIGINAFGLTHMVLISFGSKVFLKHIIEQT
jgi:hypothetical protein